MKKFILSIISIFCFYPATNAGNKNAMIKLISEAEQSHYTSMLQEKSLSGFGFELYRQWGSKEDRVSERIEGIGLLLEVSLLAGQITNSDTSDIVDVKKNVLEVGIRVDW